MLLAPDQVLFQKKLTNFQKLLFIYNKSLKNGYYRSKKHKFFYLSLYQENQQIIVISRNFQNFIQNILPRNYRVINHNSLANNNKLILPSFLDFFAQELLKFVFPGIIEKFLGKTMDSE